MRSFLVFILLLFFAPFSFAQAPDTSQERPYDRDLFQLSDYLGLISYLEPLCADQPLPLEEVKAYQMMQELIASEGFNEKKRQSLIFHFNNAYRSLSFIHKICNAHSRSILEKYKVESHKIAQNILTLYGQ